MGGGSAGASNREASIPRDKMMSCCAMSLVSLALYKVVSVSIVGQVAIIVYSSQLSPGNENMNHI